MSFSLRRSGGMPPAADELLSIAEDGSWTMHRTQAVGAVGSFAGTLAGDDLERLTEAPDEDDTGGATPGGGPAGGPPPAITPDAQAEQVDLGGHRLSLGVYDDPPEGWAEQVATLRDLLDELTDHPTAAVALAVSVDPPSARLQHAGAQALTVGPDPIEVQVTVWGADGSVLTQASHQVEVGTGEQAEEVGPGWELPLEVGDWTPQAGQWLQVEVGLEIADDAGRRRASISAMVEVTADA